MSSIARPLDCASRGRDLDHGLDLGNRSVDVLAPVQSTRAKHHAREFNTALAPWRCWPSIREFTHRPREELRVAAKPLSVRPGA